MMMTERKPNVPGITNMRKQQGRDNKMYHISDGFNLNSTYENPFNSLLTLNGVSPTQQSSMANLPQLNS